MSFEEEQCEVCGLTRRQHKESYTLDEINMGICMKFTKDFICKQKVREAIEKLHFHLNIIATDKKQAEDINYAVTELKEKLDLI